MLLGRGTEQCGQQVHLGDAVFVDDAFDASAIHGIDHGEWAALGHLRLFDVAGHDILVAESFAQAFHQFGADLARGANDEDLLHESVNGAKAIQHQHTPEWIIDRCPST